MKMKGKMMTVIMYPDSPRLAVIRAVLAVGGLQSTSSF